MSACCWCCFEEEEIIQHQETLIDLTRYTLLLLLCTYTDSSAWMIDSDTILKLTFFYGLLIVNDVLLLLCIKMTELCYEYKCFVTYRQTDRDCFLLFGHL